MIAFKLKTSIHLARLRRGQYNRFLNRCCQGGASGGGMTRLANLREIAKTKPISKNTCVAKIQLLPENTMFDFRVEPKILSRMTNQRYRKDGFFRSVRRRLFRRARFALVRKTTKPLPDLTRKPDKVQKIIYLISKAREFCGAK
jgi:hypothetical protein